MEKSLFETYLEMALKGAERKFLKTDKEEQREKRYARIANTGNKYLLSPEFKLWVKKNISNEVEVNKYNFLGVIINLEQDKEFKKQDFARKRDIYASYVNKIKKFLDDKTKQLQQEAKEKKQNSSVIRPFEVEDGGPFRSFVIKIYAI